MNPVHPAHRLINAALARLINGDPLPLDLVAKLFEYGIDVSALERRYA